MVSVGPARPRAPSRPSGVARPCGSAADHPWGFSALLILAWWPSRWVRPALTYALPGARAEWLEERGYKVIFG